MGGASIANDSKGFANQGASPIGGGGRSGSANGGGGGGGQGGGNFGSTGGGTSSYPPISHINPVYIGGGGYGTVGSFGVHNIGSPGGSAGNTYGAPDLTVLDMGSGGMCIYITSIPPHPIIIITLLTFICYRRLRTSIH